MHRGGICNKGTRIIFTNINEMILSDNVLKKRVFKQQILDLHLKDFMIGQTTPYLNKFKNTLDIGAATGMYLVIYLNTLNL